MVYYKPTKFERRGNNIKRIVNCNQPMVTYAVENPWTTFVRLLSWLLF